MYLDIEFSKLFKNKHGDKIFDDINSKIKAENADLRSQLSKVTFELESVKLENAKL